MKARIRQAEGDPGVAQAEKLLDGLRAGLPGVAADDDTQPPAPPDDAHQAGLEFQPAAIGQEGDGDIRPLGLGRQVPQDIQRLRLKVVDVVNVKHDVQKLGVRCQSSESHIAFNSVLLRSHKAATAWSIIVWTASRSCPCAAA